MNASGVLFVKRVRPDLVLQVLYLLFNEGTMLSQGPDLG
jgi:hypothetical protein